MSKRVVITGASRGLGRAMATEFARRGHTVRVCARSAIEPPLMGVQVDVSQPEQVQDWAARVLSEVGPPDLLINNAGVINRNAPLWEVSPSEFELLLKVNLAGIHNCVRAFVPAMLEAGRGVVVNFSSTWGRSVSPEVAPYCATKWGVEGLTRALAAELPGGLAAVAFNPGVIDTDMLRSCFGGSAGSFPGPDAWAAGAVDLLLGLGPADSGKSLAV
ncbi:MAG: SDR family oxidoreductase [Vulcanimicrobiota bacterium]